MEIFAKHTYLVQVEDTKQILIFLYLPATVF